MINAFADDLAIQFQRITALHLPAAELAALMIALAASTGTSFIIGG